MSVGEAGRGTGGEPRASGAPFDELIELSQRFGRDPEFSRAGGGNSSAKIDGVLWIKPSGVPLATLTAQELVPLDPAPLLALLDAAPGAEETGDDPVMRTAMAARLAPAGGRRPSVELLFHALIPERFVLHTHPIVINAVTCNRDGAALATRLFGDRVLWIPYTDPGLPLARAIAAARRAFEERTGAPPPGVTLLANHGLIVAADAARDIDEASAWLVETILAAMGDRAPAAGLGADRSPAAADSRARALVDEIGPALRARLATGEHLRIVSFDDAPAAAAFTATPQGRAFALGGPLTPDQIVYTGSWPLLLDVPADLAADDVPALLRDRLEAHLAERGSLPVIVVVPGLGVFSAGDTWAQADTARLVYLDALRVGMGALVLGGVRHLADAERRFIEAWEAEAYRRQVASGTGAAGRAVGRVALVTGAAQGFGLAIAADLVAQGAHVVLADLNLGLAEANAADLEARFGAGRATAVGMDVMDEQSVADGLHATVRRLGGLDLLVSNAGVLRAGGVTTQPLAEFDLVTKVNYRGYFLAVRFAAPVLARQHRARPAYWGDIIEINSKSGLAGSSRNSAYAGSKFGGIGLTQSFALELVGDGIKVNAVCPGNFLDGPLWSDPDNGLFVQYLREGKVPGARTIDDVRHFYESRVPMGRGCTPADVLEALYYLVAQRYETGQALPVTGGQVMLS
jgi:rhamnose utilization protein RhaD (predicted bifunctional aldolase and dehydrogenase)/NAD(P)-dependent dehydrogenase (short-subunit alcohol dehydrogenase family)